MIAEFSFEDAPPVRVGVVVIGRNEGPRLRQCLSSVRGERTRVVYVDSGSTDDSLDIARGLSVDTVELDMSVPFSAARARNAGVKRLLEQSERPVTLLQFIDGDCELVPDWMDQAERFLGQRSEVVAVCGRLMERFPDRSVYNLLCDIEWNRPPGEISACGGIFMMRAQAFLDAGGFSEHMVSGEEPELCARLRHKGWRLWRLPASMAWHDAAMYRFSQWWIRSRRSGYGYAQTALAFGDVQDRESSRRFARVFFWGGLLPAAIIAGALLLSPWTWLCLAIYPVQIARVAMQLSGPLKVRCLRSYFLMLGKFPEFLGALQFVAGRLRGAGPGRFDYKT